MIDVHPANCWESEPVQSKKKPIPYQQGVEARKNGYERISPYTNCAAEKQWYAGYDGE